MALIEAYEEQCTEVKSRVDRANLYHTLYKDVGAKLERLDKLEKQGGTSHDRWGSTLSGAKQDLEDVDEVLTKLNMEIRSLKGETKASVQSRLKQYKIDVAVCKETLQALQSKGQKAGSEAERKDLLGESAGQGRVAVDPKGASADHRSRMQNASERLEKSTERIKESRKVALEAEGVGADVLAEMRQQRETLLHARDGVREVDSNLGESRRLVKVMTKRMQQNKCFMWAVLGVVALIIVTIVFMSLQPSGPTLDQQPQPLPLSTPPALGTPSDPDPPLIDAGAANAQAGAGAGGRRRFRSKRFL